MRLPIGEDSECVPVGVVSRDYALLQHSSVCDEAKKALEDAKIDPAKRLSRVEADRARRAHEVEPSPAGQLPVRPR